MSRGYPLALVLVALALAGCSSGGDSGKSAASASPSGTARASGSGSPTPTATSTAAPLPGSCQSLLPLIDLDEALGVPMVGQTNYIKGVAEPKIKRTGRVTCRYGIVKVGHNLKPPKLEVGVSTYTDDAAATQRVETTVTGLRSEGATPTDVQVNGVPAKVLSTSAGGATLVVATGSRTVVMTLAEKVIKPADTVKVLTAIGTIALKNLPTE
jgi:hypothetical protein